VHAIVEVGYRHLDTAKLYGNEDVIGKALQECFRKGIKREDLFITTKIWKKDYADVEGAIKGSLERLQLEYVDLYLIHWMVTEIDWDNAKVTGPSMHEVWKQMETVFDSGLAKNIGVSNCPAMLFLDLLATAKVTPAVNQIESNPYFHQTDLIEITRKFGCETTAYAPMGASTFTGNDMLDDETLKAIAEKHDASVAQICLVWQIQRNVVVIPKSTNNERMKKNFEASNINLDEEDITKIGEIDKQRRKFDPKNWADPEIDWKNMPIWS
jgi:alcohol dehydrogenase (NADP+)